MCAIQDQVFNTKNYRTFFVKDGTVDACRGCNSAVENVQRIISGCLTLTQLDYKARHDRVVKILHEKLALHYSLLMKAPSTINTICQRSDENNLAH